MIIITLQDVEKAVNAINVAVKKARIKTNEKKASTNEKLKKYQR